MGTCNPATGTCTCNTGCFGDDCSNICTASNCCGLTSIKTLTRSTPSWAKMDATLKFQICHGELGNCCWTDELDDTNKNDFELGNIKAFLIVSRQALKCYVLSFKELFCTAGITKPYEIITYLVLSLCLFLSVCFFEVKGISLEPTYLDTI